MRIDTNLFNPVIRSGAPGFGMGMQLRSGGSLVPYAGGVLLTQDATVVGALGVSGAALADTDHEIAKSVIAEYELQAR
ncbi:heme-binding protein [Phytohabitans aurantiacus]|uniref:Uncharacterized protein n=1 Tax=Phytohabitans aurantiacus TaxID=3016789 RepID=A0ABQ5QX82_9ACTN|nr:heme-binding protein [Phytohabitans aurantiacus]GLH98632.1 hypothetical protein Pa4123_39070 [Phytohabitans aurantiacus]